MKYTINCCGQSKFESPIHSIEAASEKEALDIFATEYAAETGVDKQHFWSNFEAIEIA